MRRYPIDPKLFEKKKNPQPIRLFKKLSWQNLPPVSLNLSFFSQSYRNNKHDNRNERKFSGLTPIVQSALSDIPAFLAVQVYS